MDKKEILTWRLSWLLVGAAACLFALSEKHPGFLYGLALGALQITAALLPPSFWEGRVLRRLFVYLTSLLLSWVWFALRQTYLGERVYESFLSPILFLPVGTALFLDRPREALILIFAIFLPISGVILRGEPLKLAYHLVQLAGWVALSLAAWLLFRFLRHQREAFLQQEEELKRLEREYRLLKDRLARAEYLAITDPLTELYNLRYFEQVLEGWLRELRPASRLSLLMVDIDYFKEINDTFGHQVGNKVLVEVAGLLKRHVREKDVVARYGGEEFALLLLGADRYKAQQVAERIRNAVASSVFALDMGFKVRLTVSIGIASWPEDAHDQRELIQRADRALYIAKSSGRNMICSSGGEEADATLPK
ncbi:MAG: GGDEF domain-containing protein [Thermanaeromonas sp.]|uniref:GGDEF domain-containing protein n=1 Tax=Thermanaeromonas sp. TaxID=2003697 RepID=UPI00243B9B52|nr:GGDEF domain-containing protein [Thermanaeromonas sp.]MCG0277431.1 GGDEF domain-containing protein [Thermanaeromonas sp.]